MAYEGGSLTEFFDDGPQEETELAARRMAEKGGRRWQEITTINTPIKSGNLRSSWYSTPANKTRKGAWPAYESKVETIVKYAPYVEYGTGIYGPKHAPYVILPKHGKVLAWRDPKTGRMVFARKVIHPGSPGNHMLAIGGAATEADMQGSLFVSELEEWATGVEASVR